MICQQRLACHGRTAIWWAIWRLGTCAGAREQVRVEEQVRLRHSNRARPRRRAPGPGLFAPSRFCPCPEQLERGAAPRPARTPDAARSCSTVPCPPFPPKSRRSICLRAIENELVFVDQLFFRFSTRSLPQCFRAEALVGPGQSGCPASTPTVSSGGWARCFCAGLLSRCKNGPICGAVPRSATFGRRSGGLPGQAGRSEGRAEVWRTDLALTASTSPLVVCCTWWRVF